MPKATQLLSVVNKISTVLKNNEDAIMSPKADAFLGLVTSYVARELIVEYDDYYDNRASENGGMGEFFDSYIEVKSLESDKTSSVKGLYIEEEDVVKDFELNDRESIERGGGIYWKCRDGNDVQVSLRSGIYGLKKTF